MRVSSGFSVSPEDLKRIVGTFDHETTEGMVEKIVRSGLIDERQLGTRLARRFLSSEVRRAIKKIRDDEGMPVVHNVIVEDEDGNKRHAYVQQDLMNLDEYKQAIQFYVEKANYNATVAKHLESICFQKHRRHVQLRFVFSS